MRSAVQWKPYQRSLAVDGLLPLPGRGDSVAYAPDDQAKVLSSVWGPVFTRQPALPPGAEELARK